MTFMEYHDVGVIPPLYLAMWQYQLRSPARLFPAAVNFAQAFEQLNDPEQATYWWGEFESYRANKQPSSSIFHP